MQHDNRKYYQQEHQGDKPVRFVKKGFDPHIDLCHRSCILPVFWHVFNLELVITGRQVHVACRMSIFLQFNPVAVITHQPVCVDVVAYRPVVEC